MNITIVININIYDVVVVRFINLYLIKLYVTLHKKLKPLGVALCIGIISESNQVLILIHLQILRQVGGLEVSSDCYNFFLVRILTDICFAVKSISNNFRLKILFQTYQISSHFVSNFFKILPCTLNFVLYPI